MGEDQLLYQRELICGQLNIGDKIRDLPPALSKKPSLAYKTSLPKTTVFPINLCEQGGGNERQCGPSAAGEAMWEYTAYAYAYAYSQYWYLTCDQALGGCNTQPCCSNTTTQYNDDARQAKR